MERTETFVGQSNAVLDAVERASRAAALNRPVLVIGERGTARPLDRVEECKALADKLICSFHLPTCGVKSHHVARYFGEFLPVFSHFSQIFLPGDYLA